jgi:hypothetical protein
MEKNGKIAFWHPEQKKKRRMKKIWKFPFGFRFNFSSFFKQNKNSDFFSFLEIQKKNPLKKG